MPLVPVPKSTFAQKLKRFFMVDLLKGLGVTLQFNIGALISRDSVAGKGIYTEQYPKVRPDVAPRFHGAPRLNMDPETHDTLCIACNLCALACPEDCIDVIAMDSAPCARKRVPLIVSSLLRTSSWRRIPAPALSGTGRCSNRAGKLLNTNRRIDL